MFDMDVSGPVFGGRWEGGLAIQQRVVSLLLSEIG